METADKIAQLEKRVEQLTNVILDVASDDTDSLASRYIKEKLNSLHIPNTEKVGRQEMIEQVITLVYEHYYMYNRNFFGKDSEQALQIKNLIHDLREIQAQEMEKA